MSLHASLDLSNPMTSQSGAVFAPVMAQNVGVDTGSATHFVNTHVQSGLARKTKKNHRKHDKKSSHKKSSHSKRKTMNKTRKHHSKKHKKSHTRKHLKRVNQVGGGSSYEQVLAHMPGMGPKGMPANVQAVSS